MRDNRNENIDDSIQILFGMLGEAIDDLENGRVISEEEIRKELEAIL